MQNYLDGNVIYLIMQYFVLIDFIIIINDLNINIENKAVNTNGETDLINVFIK